MAGGESDGCGGMTAAAAQVQDRTRGGARRLAVTWILLFAFALQSYVTQTHFHERVVQPAPRVSVQTSSPGGGEALACPLCQAVASAGVFLTPDVTAALSPAVWSILVSPAPAATGRATGPAGFAWRSRAPPRS